jgi:hypothetical protein
MIRSASSIQRLFRFRQSIVGRRCSTIQIMMRSTHLPSDVRAATSRIVDWCIQTRRDISKGSTYWLVAGRMIRIFRLIWTDSFDRIDATDYTLDACSVRYKPTLNRSDLYIHTTYALFLKGQTLHLSTVLTVGFLDGRFGVVVGILAYYERGRGFDSRTVQTFVCLNMSVCVGLGVSM